jgi:hypothetical protein
MSTLEAESLRATGEGLASTSPFVIVSNAQQKKADARSLLNSDISHAAIHAKVSDFFSCRD